MNVYGVSFKEDGKIYNFLADGITCPINVTVIVETEKGLQFGKVVSEVDINTVDVNSLKKIVRISTKKDYDQFLTNLKDAKEALNFTKSEAEALNLDMTVIDASFTFDRKQLLINFVSDKRVDFRDLAKSLAAKYHTRIELHQVGARDKAKVIGGLGICGHELCCKKFLSKIQTVTMNMAKDQNLALNPSKINGCCGRLLCCLTYEDDVYLEYSKGMPEVGQTVKTEAGVGVVVSVDILKRKYRVSIDNDIKEIELDKK